MKRGFDASDNNQEWYNYQITGNPYDPRQGIWGWNRSFTRWSGDGITKPVWGNGFLLEFNPPTEINYIGWGKSVNYTDDNAQTNFLKDATINFYVSKSTNHLLKMIPQTLKGLH